MKILALDTSGKAQSLALLSNDIVLAEVQYGPLKSHTEKILPNVLKLLKSQAIELSDIDLFAVTSGPGAFTGIRIGLSVVKAFAWGLKKPMVAVGTLQAMAAPFYTEQSDWVMPCIDARMGEVYGAAYRKVGTKLEMGISPVAANSAVFWQQVSQLSGEKVFLGTGAPLVVPPNRNDLIVGEPSQGPRASWVGRLALEMFNRGDDGFGQQMTPNYLRVSTAEKNLREKGGVR